METEQDIIKKMKAGHELFFELSTNQPFICKNFCDTKSPRPDIPKEVFESLKNKKLIIQKAIGLARSKWELTRKAKTLKQIKP